MAVRPPAFDRLWGNRVHEDDVRFERVTRELFEEEEPQDAVGAQAWLIKWKYWAELSKSRKTEANRRLIPLQKAVDAGDVPRDLIPKVLSGGLPKGKKCTAKVLLQFGHQGLKRWADILQLVEGVKTNLKSRVDVLRKKVAAELAASRVAAGHEAAEQAAAPLKTDHKAAAAGAREREPLLKTENKKKWTPGREARLATLEAEKAAARRVKPPQGRKRNTTGRVGRRRISAGSKRELQALLDSLSYEAQDKLYDEFQEFFTADVDGVGSIDLRSFDLYEKLKARAQQEAQAMGAEANKDGHQPPRTGHVDKKPRTHGPDQMLSKACDTKKADRAEEEVEDDAVALPETRLSRKVVALTNKEKLTEADEKFLVGVLERLSEPTQDDLLLVLGPEACNGEFVYFSVATRERQRAFICELARELRLAARAEPLFPHMSPARVAESACERSCHKELTEQLVLADERSLGIADNAEAVARPESNAAHVVECGSESDVEALVERCQKKLAEQPSVAILDKEGAAADAEAEQNPQEADSFLGDSEAVLAVMRGESAWF